MTQVYKEINVTCPICQNSKFINVPEDVFAQKKFGSIKIQIPPGAVCNEHQFIVFVDQKGVIRGYEKIDILMGAPSEEEEVIAEDLSTRNLIRIFGLYGALTILHAYLFKHPTFIVKDETLEKFSEGIILMLKKLLPSEYNEPEHIHFISQEEFEKSKFKDKNIVVIDAHKNILQTAWDRKLKFEESLVKKVLEIIDNEEQILLMKQEINNFLKEVRVVLNIVDDDSIKEVFENDVISSISKELKTSKINKNRLLLIKEFISQYYSPKLSRKIKSKLQGFLNLL